MYRLPSPLGPGRTSRPILTGASWGEYQSGPKGFLGVWILQPWQRQQHGSDGFLGAGILQPWQRLQGQEERSGHQLRQNGGSHYPMPICLLPYPMNNDYVEHIGFDSFRSTADVVSLPAKVFKWDT